MELHRNSMYKHNQLKQFVYALFTQEHKKSSYEIRNCLIFNVDQLGLNQGPPDYESVALTN